MKTLITLLILSFTVMLHAQSLSMSDFRKVQRQYVLTEFKALYKQRHLSSHKAALRQKHERVKKISHSGILMNQYQNNSETGGRGNSENGQPHQQAMPQNASMQIQANYELSGIKQHQGQHGESPISNDTHPNEPPVMPNNPNNSTNQNPNITDLVAPVETSMQHSDPIPNTNTPLLPVDTPVQNSNSDPFTPTPVMQTQQQNETNPSETEIPITQESLPVTSTNTMPDAPTMNSFETPHIRSLSANPWGRR